MHTYFRNSLLVLAALSLASNSAVAAPQSRVKERGSITVTATLAATLNAPAGAAGSAVIEVSKPKFRDVQTAELALTTTGLSAGSYSVDASLQDLSTAHLGDLIVEAAVPGDDAGATPVVFVISAEVDPLKITTVRVSDSAAAVVLEGAATATVNDWKLIANVQVTGPESVATVEKGGPKPKRVQGHALAKSFIKDGVETKRQFLWVAKGATAGSELTINVNGTAVATVTSAADGKVMFAELPETVVLRELDTVTLTDSAGTVVMQAEF